MIDYKKFVENSRKWLSKYIKDNHLQSRDDFDLGIIV